MVILFPPTLAWFAYGQATPFILLIFTLSFALLRSGKDFMAGIVLGMLAFKPQLAIPLVLPIIINFRWSAIAGGIISGGMWVAIGFYLFPEQMIQYWHIKGNILTVISSQEFPFWGVHSLYGFVHLLLRGTWVEATSSALTFIFTAALMLFLLSQWYKEKWQPGTEQWDLLMAGTIVLGLCFAVHLYTYDLMLLLLPFFIILRVFEKFGSRLDNGPIFAATVVVYLCCLLSALLTKGRLALMKNLGFTPIGIQLSTIFMVIWAIVVLQLGHSNHFRAK